MASCIFLINCRSEFSFFFFFFFFFFLYYIFFFFFFIYFFFFFFFFFDSKNKIIMDDSTQKLKTPTLSELKKQNALGESTIEKVIEGFLASYHNGLTKDHNTM